MADVGLTKAQVIGVCGELADPRLTADQWTLVLELAQAQLNPGENGFGSVTKANYAGRYLAAHIALRLLAMATTGGSSGGGVGSLSSVTVGNVSKVFRTPGAVDTVRVQDADFLNTVPGREYLRLMRLWSGRVVAV